MIATLLRELVTLQTHSSELALRNELKECLTISTRRKRLH